MTKSPHTVVVGAGVAGLTIAHQLITNDRPATVIERDSFVGGLGRSWHYEKFHFDVGPHRFHTENPRVAAFIRGILEEDAIEIPRVSGAYMFGKFHEWPLRPSVIFAMPIGMMIRCAVDLLHRPKVEGVSFEADVLNKYGRTLYETFFKPYTQKFLFHSPAELHRDWARAGVNRAVIDKRVAADTLWSLLKTTLLPKPVETTFLYPPEGVGRYADRLHQIIVERGGAVALGRPVDAVEIRGDRIVAVSSAGERLACDHVVWTAPITKLNDLLGIRGISLNYLSTIFYNFEVAGPLRHNFQWTYHGGDEIFSRVSAPTAFAATTAPAGSHGLCVELTCRKGDERWTDPDRYTAAIVVDLVRTKTIESPGDILATHIERVPETYPIYTLDYLDQLTGNLKALSAYRNLLLAGRSGRFWYNNMDHSIGQGLTMADKILRGQVFAEIDDEGREFWTDPPEAADAAAAGVPDE